MESYFTTEEKKVFTQGYNTAIRLSEVLLNMFNSNVFKEVDLSGLMLCSDKKHKKLFFKVLSMEADYINNYLYDDFSELIINRTKSLKLSEVKCKS